ncbi:putative transcriptional regulator with CopG/Arc/MetJ DNA-binding domain and metal-binding domain [Metallosphaera yellowstonensis MK1]|jgi:metal-responsive CopG/Arc/MetJ family transcriptional regulator|uniref:Putative transcriptional regulator with CopG/Arc/MetJ DNA-binding domain and metal-binding domain n=1 Tax=Metallosphaera yellowstonensis MK1 TaxID=671065 RepID=H2C1R4_9CREN|nr:ribbon-helix-helix domain-containing protein [Metallosphaera yellowstonensis]EHP70185.1 putative transcriptional regulator with CopG/Arc/MetJ DNA-binding domain and metal-binding domain [Metallosphaera yellowstonensis MK1]
MSERVRKKNGVRPNITNITVYLDREDAKKLGQLAKEQGLPGKSTLIRQLIKHYLKRHSS